MRAKVGYATRLGPDGHGHADSDAGATVQVRVALYWLSSSAGFVSAEALPILFTLGSLLAPGGEGVCFRPCHTQLLRLLARCASTFQIIPALDNMPSI
jgi:hypothetical protein